MTSSNSITIELKGLHFFAFHGVYADEAKVGSPFEINASISFTSEDAIIDEIQKTVNYVALYDVIKQVMEQREELLETVVSNIIHKISENFSGINFVEIQLIKLQVPIVNFQGNVAVTFRRRF